MATEHPELPSSVLHAVIEKYPPIDWRKMALACAFYAQKGFEYLETPWVIPAQYSKLTKPHDDPTFIFEKGLFSLQPNELVGSAEQGFLYLIQNNLLPKGKFYSVSPCFRTDTYDATHQPWFLKLELIDTNVVDADKQLKQIMDLAYEFFTTIKNNDSVLEIVALPDGSKDINLNDIEIGSYGVRKMCDTPYIYATGLALPRFDVANKV